jgi:hypothetical protein
MRFARIVFAAAAVWGFLVLTPQYFLESYIAENSPPAITHPEFFYGFIGVALAFQVVFAIIATDPARYRPMMIAAIVEKLSFAVAASALYANSRLAADMFAAGMIDLALGVLFAVSYLKTSGKEASAK